MAVYAIGDVQGCYDELVKLLDRINYDPTVDQIWLAGDIVNRGPNSLDVLRFAKNNPENVRVVLGNHDMHLIAMSANNFQHQHHMDTLQQVFDAEDCDELLFWLRQQPLIYHDQQLGFSMLHAGLPPQWTLEQAICYANEVHSVIRGEHWHAFFTDMYGNKPNQWSESLKGMERLRYITNCFTRLRYCHNDGRLALKFKGHPDQRPEGQTSWFEMPNRQTAEDRIVFGHWSTLGTGQYGNVFSLDSGVVWGDKLTAVRIDQDPYQWFEVDADPKGLPFAKNK
jgi:bis(5'-nucleosyl)-tetraphosphatase (symmetrical)